MPGEWVTAEKVGGSRTGNNQDPLTMLGCADVVCWNSEARRVGGVQWPETMNEGGGNTDEGKTAVTPWGGEERDDGKSREEGRKETRMEEGEAGYRRMNRR